MLRWAHKPGDRVNRTGVFWVYHYAHRISHAARMHEGEAYPACSVCGDRVRFEDAAPELEPDAWPIEWFADFRGNVRSYDEENDTAAEAA